MTAVACASVFLLAENRLLREALARILSKRNGIQVVGAATSSPAVLDVIEAAAPQVLLFDPLDISSGITFLRTLREALPELKVIMIGMEMDSEVFLLSVREGVAGYLLMDATAVEIVAAVRTVVEGGAVCPPELCHALFQQVAAQGAGLPILVTKNHLGLTNREQQLIEMVSRGLTNKEIALELGLSEQTVKNHMHRILRKAGVNDRLQAVAVYRGQARLAM